MPSELGPTTKLPKPQVLQLFQFTPTLPWDTFKPIAGAALWPIILVFRVGQLSANCLNSTPTPKGIFPMEGHSAHAHNRQEGPSTTHCPEAALIQ